MISVSVFLTSLAAIAFEILLTRLFSLSQWNYLSFMVISIALFGFAAGGTWLSIYDIRNQGRTQEFLTPTRVAYLNLFYTVSTLFSFLLVNYLELDYYRLPVQPIQAFYLLTVYVALALPFFFTGIVISGAYIASPEKTGIGVSMWASFGNARKLSTWFRLPQIIWECDSSLWVT